MLFKGEPQRDQKGKMWEARFSRPHEEEIKADQDPEAHTVTAPGMDSCILIPTTPGVDRCGPVSASFVSDSEGRLHCNLQWGTVGPPGLRTYPNPAVIAASPSGFPGV